MTATFRLISGLIRSAVRRRAGTAKTSRTERVDWKRISGFSRVVKRGNSSRVITEVQNLTRCQQKDHPIGKQNEEVVAGLTPHGQLPYAVQWLAVLAFKSPRTFLNIDNASDLPLSRCHFFLHGETPPR